MLRFPKWPLLRYFPTSLFYPSTYNFFRELHLPSPSYTPWFHHPKNLANNIIMILDFKLSPCFESCMYSFGYFPGVRLWFADVSEHSICSIFMCWILHIQPMKMEQIECSETLAYNNQTPGKYLKEYIQHNNDYFIATQRQRKSRKIEIFYLKTPWMSKN